MTKVSILFGGPGSEHEVSISSARNILKNIDRESFEILEVFVDKNIEYIIEANSFGEVGGLQEIKKWGAEIIFPVFHGSYGEGGILQKKLEDLGIPFVGSSSSASTLAINKYETSKVLTENKIKTPQESIISNENIVHRCSYPIIVKPISEGSSVGLYKFENEKEFLDAKNIIFQNHTEMLVQEYISGREFTCGIIEKNGSPLALLATEIILSKSKLFDYEAKYTPEGCREITPADIDHELMEKIQKISMMCHRIIGCSSISRTDMILSDNEIYVLETNTMPGMTETSFIPAQALASGYSMKDLITLLIQSGRAV